MDNTRKSRADVQQLKLNFSFDARKRISKKHLSRIWRGLTDKVFPNGEIHAYVLDELEFRRVTVILNNYEGTVNDPLKEYGDTPLPIDKCTTAFITRQSKGDGSMSFLICVNKKSPYTLEEDLRHELGHIIKGDIVLNR